MTEKECFDKIKEYRYLRDSFKNSLNHMKFEDSKELVQFYIKECELKLHILEEMLYLGECEDSHDL